MNPPAREKASTADINGMGMNLARRSQQTESPPVSEHKPAWNDAPLRAKVMLLIALAAVGGCLVGMLEVYFGHQSYPLVLGLGLLAIVLHQLGKRWCWQPMEKLLAQCKAINYAERPVPLRHLPTGRHDEVGQVARLVHNLIAWTMREHLQSHQLRRHFEDQLQSTLTHATRNLEKLALRDPLTGLGNRRFMDEHYDKLIESARKTKTDTVMIVVDVDNFKQVNDTLGHTAGDDLLIFTANLIKASIRAEDYAARFGGDEFVLLMPGCTMDQAAAITRRLVVLFRQHCQIALQTPVPVSLSIGIASLKTDQPTDTAELMEIADRRLYAAKESGKNQIVQH